MSRPQRKKYIIQLTGFTQDVRDNLGKKIQQLGGIYYVTESFIKESTHIVCGRPSRSEKFLGALAMGKWILTADFIKSSHRYGRWLSEDSFEWDSSNCGQLTAADQETFLQAPKRWRLQKERSGMGSFSDWTAAVMVDNIQKRNIYTRLLQNGGCRVLKIKLPFTPPKIRPLTHLFVDEKCCQIVKDVAGLVPCLSPAYIGAFLIMPSTPRLKDYTACTALSVPTKTPTGGCRVPDYCSPAVVSSASPSLLRNLNTMETYTQPSALLSSRSSFEAAADILSQETIQGMKGDRFNVVKLCPIKGTKPALIGQNKRKYFDTTDVQLAIEKVKKMKVTNSTSMMSSWIPACHSIKQEKQATRDGEKVRYQASETMDALFEACLEEGHMVQALDTAMSFTTQVRYPQPKTLHAIMAKILLTSECPVLSHKAHITLRQILCLHPPTSPALQAVYRCALQPCQQDGAKAEGWQFVRTVIGNCYCPSLSIPERKNHLLLLKFLVAVMEASFQHFILRKQEGGKKPSPCLMAELMWPTGRLGHMNMACHQLHSATLEVAQMHADEISSQTAKIELLTLLQSLICMVAECCRLAGHNQPVPVQCLDTLPENAQLFAREWAHGIRGELDENSEDFQLVLNYNQPIWLTVKVCETLLDLYDDRLLPVATHCQILTLQKIVSQYFYLLPPVEQSFAVSPHKKNQARAVAQPLWTLEETNLVGNFEDCQTRKGCWGSPDMGKSVLKPGTPDSSIRRKMATINRRNIRGETPLHIACIKNNVTKLRELLQVPGVDVNLKDFAGWTPVHEACNHGHVECVRELLRYRPTKTITSYFKKGVINPNALNLTAANEDGITPLHDAVQNNHVEVARLLLLHGGEELLKACCKSGHKPADLAVTAEMKSILAEPHTPIPATPLKKRLFNSQGSSQGSPTCSQSGVITFQPSDEVYCEVLGAKPVSKYASKEECRKYMMLLFRLLCSYINYYDLASVCFNLNVLNDNTAKVRNSNNCITIQQTAASIPDAIELKPTTGTKQTRNSVATSRLSLAGSSQTTSSQPIKSDLCDSNQISRRRSNRISKQQDLQVNKSVSPVEDCNTSIHVDTKETAENIQFSMIKFTERIKDDIEILCSLKSHVEMLEMHLLRISGLPDLQFCCNILLFMNILSG